MINYYLGIALSFGYVESNTTSWLIYHAENKISSSRREAIHSLVAYLWDKYTKQNDENHEFSLGYSYGSKCCQRHWLDTKYVDDPQKQGARKKREINPTSCPTCNGEYPTTWTFEEEDWKEYLFDLHHSDCNSYGEHEWPDNPYGWSPWMYSFNIPQHQMVVIGEQAEDILTMALYELHPELMENSEDEEPTYFEANGVENPWDRDYQNLMDESCVLDDYGCHYHKAAETPRARITQTIDYPNGGQAILVDNIITYVKYNTGDQIWLEFQDGKYRVAKVHDYMGRISHTSEVDPYCR